MSNLTTAAYFLSQLQLIFLKIQREWDPTDPDQDQWGQQIERASAFCHHIFNQVAGKVERIEEEEPKMNIKIKKVKAPVKKSKPKAKKKAKKA